MPEHGQQNRLRGLLLDVLAVAGLGLLGYGVRLAVSRGAACIVVGILLLAASIIGVRRTC